MPVFKLDSNRVPIFWDLIKPGLILGRNISGIEGDWDFANRVLEMAISDQCQVWLAFERGEVTGDNYAGFAVTTIATDVFSKTKDLVIYFIYTYRQASQELRTAGALAAYKFAGSKGCKRVVVYTDNKKVEQSIESFLGNNVKKRSLFFVDLEGL